jgi:hypothetical protein
MSMEMPKYMKKEYFKWYEPLNDDNSDRILKAKPNAPKEAKEALEKFYKETEEALKKGWML